MTNQYLSVEMVSTGGRTVAFQTDGDGELTIAINGDDVVLNVESFQRLREWLAQAAPICDHDIDTYASLGYGVAECKKCGKSWNEKR